MIWMNRGSEPIDDQNEIWKSGTRVSIETLVEKHSIDDQQIIADLIYNEVLLRESVGETPELGDYDSRFPHLADALSRQFQVHRAMHSPSMETDRDGITPVDRRSVSIRKPKGIDGFELLEILGRGGSAVCWRAKDTKLNREVAIKLLTRNAADDESGESLLKEARAAASLRHPGIVEIHQVGKAENFPFLVMECCNGGSVANKLTAGPMLPSDAAAMAEKVARAVHHAHQNGIIHRDLKPGNILLDEDGQPHIADFGLAKQLNPEETRQTTRVVGTPAYMSPEQARGAAASETADVYSIGATLYEMLTGRPPFQTASVWDTLYQVMQNDAVPARQLNDRVPQDLETICAKCLEKDPQRRYASAGELADELQRFLGGKPILASPVSTLEMFRRWCGRNRALAGSLLTVAALVSTLAVGSVFAAVYFKRQNRKLADAMRNSIDAADELLVSVTEDAQLLPKSPGSQKVSKRLLERAQGYYVSFLDQNEGDPDLTFQLARTHAGQARIAAAFEDSKTVASETEAALELLDEIESEAATFETHLLRGRVNHVLGVALQEEMNSEEALGYHVNAIAAYENALEFRPDETDARLQLCKAKLGLGVVSRSLGDMEQAEITASEARENLGEILELNPEMSSAVIVAAMAESNLAVLKFGKDMSQLQRHLASSIELLASLPDEDRDTVDVRVMRMKNYLNSGYGFSHFGELEKSAEVYALAIAEARQLVELEPAIASHKRNYVIAVMNSGSVDNQSNNYQRLADRVREVLPSANQLIEETPDNMSNLELKGMLLGNLSVALRHLEQYDEALDTVQQSVDTAELIAEGTGGTPESQYTLALSHYQKGQLLIEMDRIDEALEAVEASRKATNVGLKTDPNDTSLAVQVLDLYVLEIDALVERDPKPADRIVDLATKGLSKAEKLRVDHEDLYLDLAYGSLLLTLAEENLENGTPEKSLLFSSRIINEFHPEGNEPEVEDFKDVLIDAYCLKAKSLSERKGTPSEEDSDGEQIRDSLDAAKALGASDDQLSAL